MIQGIMKSALRVGFLAVALGMTAGVMTLPAMAQAMPATTAGTSATAHVTAHVTTHKTGQPEAKESSAPPEGMDAPETEEQHNAYLHSSSVRWIAKKVGLSVPVMAMIFEWLNSGILFLVIFYFVVKYLPGIFRSRKERLAKDLVEAKELSDDARRRLAVIEERLSHLDADIEAFRKRSEHEAAEEERRMHEALEGERKRIVHSAEQEIEAVSAMAQRSLRRHAAELAVGQVRSSLKVGVSRDKELVAEFAKSIAGNHKGGKI